MLRHEDGFYSPIKRSNCVYSTCMLGDVTLFCLVRGVRLSLAIILLRKRDLTSSLKTFLKLNSTEHGISNA